MERSSKLSPLHEPAENGSMGIYFDREGQICSGHVSINVPFRHYVVVRTGGWTTCGIAGAEFRMGVLPPGWFVNAIAEPGMLEFWNPLTNGVTIGFVCRHGGEQDEVVLYTLDIWPTTEVSDLRIGVEMRQRPPSVPRARAL